MYKAAPASRETTGVVVQWHLCLTVLVFISAGCVPVPIIYQESEPAPDLSAVLPQHIASSDKRVLLLEQYSRKSGFTSSPTPALVIRPLLVAGNELPAKAEKLNAQSKFQAGVLLLSMGGGGGVAHGSVESLDRLCIISAGGDESIFTIAGRGWNTGLVPIDTRRRDALISALQSGSQTPFSDVEGPCGMSGGIDWSADTLSRVIGYLQRLPDLPARTPNPDLVQFFSDIGLQSTDPATAPAMLVAAAHLPGAYVYRSPVFLDRTLIARLKSQFEPSMIQVLFPQTRAGLESGYIWTTLQQVRLCIIENDGTRSSWGVAAGWRDATCHDDVFPGAMHWWSDPDKEAVEAFATQFPDWLRDNWRDPF
jgi:hypothetical protein